MVSKDLQFVDSNADELAHAEKIGRLLNGLIASTERRKHIP